MVDVLYTQLKNNRYFLFRLAFDPCAPRTAKILLNSSRGFQKRCISIVVSLTVNTYGEQTHINRSHILVDSDKLEQQHVLRFHYLFLKTYICNRIFLYVFLVRGLHDRMAFMLNVLPS